MPCSSSLSTHYARLLKTLSESTREQSNVKKLHCIIVKTRCSTSDDVFISNSLISAYSKCGSISYARRVFEEIPHPNLFSWNAILSAYSSNPRQHVREMERVFSAMPEKDTVSWNSVISGYANHGFRESSAVGKYREMLREEGTTFVRPNRITLSTLLILSSSKRSGSFGLGRQVHSHVVKLGFESYLFVGSPLVGMYAKSGAIEEAKSVFESMGEKNVVICNTMITELLRCGMVEDSKRLFHSMPRKDSVSWTAMITGLVENGLEEEAMDDVFRRMRLERNVEIDQYTFGSALTACGSLLALPWGKQIHGHVLRTYHNDNVFVSTALVDMYSKCRRIRYAEAVFRQMELRNTVTWTAMLVGYGQNGKFEEAVKGFREMHGGTVGLPAADDFTLGTVIGSCARLAALEEGQQLHSQSLVSGLISFVTVSNALVTLYGRCGCVDDAHRLFDEMVIRDQVSWTALVSGYAQFGRAEETLDLFEKMMSVDGVEPDGVTFVALLSACSRVGLVEKGQKLFNSMVEVYGVVPSTDHYTCMIDLLGRAGRLEEAKRFITTTMPSPPDGIGWATLLSACKLHRNMEIGNWAARSLQQLEPENPAGYVLLAGMYAATGRWAEVAELRTRMRAKGLKKEPGCSWIKHKNRVHIFSADDRSNPHSDEIYSELEKLESKMADAGYTPELGLVLHDVADAEKKRMLSHHSEKLAIAFGLIFLPRHLPIRVFKNLRVCADCHNATKFISKIVEREILVRDSVRFHLFKDGQCSCGDFW